MSMSAFCLQNLLSSADARKTLAWEFFREGVQVSWIYRLEEKNSPSSAFLKYEPGAKVPLHSHTGLEHILMLEGSQTDENGWLPPIEVERRAQLRALSEGVISQVCVRQSVAD